MYNKHPNTMFTDSSKSENLPYYKGEKIEWPKGWTHSQALFDLIESNAKAWELAGILKSSTTLIPIAKSEGDVVEEVVYYQPTDISKETREILKSGVNTMNRYLQPFYWAQYTSFEPTEKEYWKKVIKKIQDVVDQLE